ncbi:receptor-type tyrosine-protein phosphatase-like N isoform X2 [Armigeres subalbatus]|uniref:receptor-type tyrosine-protein phosphatase-like N isoform X2 n=1 Tax=Armigeres subalbatus TaxID=124917 RepID=UPI002ED2A989
MSNIDISTTAAAAWTNTYQKLVQRLLTVGVLTLAILGSSTDKLGVSAEGNIGCLFAETLCLEHLEWCYDDFAFGKCLPQYGLEPEELFREPLDEEQSRFLAVMLEDLQGARLGWEHPFTQCRMQGALFAMRTNSEIPRSLCANLAPDPEVLDPQSPLAFVRFTPPNDEYADEVYYPPLKKSQGPNSRSPISEKRFFVSARKPSKKSSPELDVLSEPILPLYPKNHQVPIVEDMVSLPLPIMDRQSERGRNRLRDNKNRAALRRLVEQFEFRYPGPQLYPSPDVTDYLDDPSPNEIEQYPLRIKPGMSYNEKRDHSIFKEQKPADVDEEKALKKLVEKLTPIDVPDYTFINQKTSSFREYANKHHIPKISNFAPENVNSVVHEKDASKLDKFYKKPHHHLNELNEIPSTFREDAQFAPSEAGLYTEGGFVYVPKPGSSKGKTEARTLLDNILGFTRHERLDVKKPGPPAAPPPSSQPANELPKEALPNDTADDDDTKMPKSKKELHLHTEDDHAPHSVDREYAHVNLKNPIDNWKDGARIVTALAEVLHLQGYFTHPRVDRHEVSFRVESNPEKKTAAEIANQINNDSRVKNNLFRRYGVLVTQAGVGDKTKDNGDGVSSERHVEEGPDVTHVMAFMFAAGAAAIIVIVITLFLIKKHDKKKDKLGGLQAGLSGADSCSKDYQDLCRARMAGKTGSNDSPGGRITTLAKEAERPPSSRSSTSSWSEEPALTNMDISTGHMVLSYMEDHLRNKGRLQREWEALCRYEAEPNARDAALQNQCAPLNRSGAPLPYDHSRVVLNHLANAEGMDYINASTITDHDPRAPAYVAAQGPMQSTLAHFWQMVWEQGAVVLVALCRLQENGEAACARYWPEEGAEVYHIYEVHLVSEHIWCDDYLVRSFYLKNLRTGETRTVTQFHFLSWPQGGVPMSAKALLDFRRKVNKSYRGRSCPIVVHSSNGSGRTGAYILLDLVLGRMNKGAREIDIAATLEHLRDQRAGLVATRQQFEFVLMAVAEEVHAILKALPQNSNASGEKRSSDPTTTTAATEGKDSTAHGKEQEDNDAKKKDGKTEK